eukprot:TRINITY_DN51284_c0_g1_i1.p1 TRINITY_DN51284_c0_g1~~TRINITY_DN51284_c0_g1_i1.p1  ORF type:complete len:686 (-),score=77.98 TRINITY_DN51284_c0_g1_i1:194-2251(-)
MPRRCHAQFHRITEARRGGNANFVLDASGLPVRAFLTAFFVAVAHSTATINDAGGLDLRGTPIGIMLDCTSDVSWSGFREALHAATANGRLELKPELTDFAVALVQSSGDHVGGMAGGADLFYHDLCGDAAQSFCLYGTANALFVIAADLHNNALASDGNEMASAQAQDYLQMGKSLLGIQHCLDFMESTSWPIRADDFLANTNRSPAVPFRLAADGTIEVAPAHQPPGLSSMFAWPPTYLAEALRGSYWLSSCPSATSGDESVHGDVTLIRIVAVGTHPTLTLEAVTMVRDFSFGEEQRVEVARIMGITYKCDIFPDMCGSGGVNSDDPIAKLIGPFEAPPPYETYTFSRIREASKTIGLQLLGHEPDLLICTSPFILCALLQEATSLPLLAYFGLPLLWKRPTDHFDDKAARAAFWKELVRLGDEPRVVMATNNPLLTEQIAFQTPNMLLPTVRPHAVFARATYAPKLQNKVLVASRTKFNWVTLGCALRRFAPDGYPFTFEILNSDSKLTFKELSSRRAAVLVPWEHALMAFFEFYSMGVPLFMPDAPWAYRLLFDSEGNLGSTKRLYEDVTPGCDVAVGCTVTRPHPFSPFDLDPLESRRYWYQYSSLAQWPHVHRFSSLAKLLELLYVVDTSRTSALMKDFNDRTFVQSVAFWRRATYRLLVGRRHCEAQVDASSSHVTQ